MDDSKIIVLLEDVASIKSDLKNAINKVTEHIENGSKWRLAIVCACIGLVGTFICGSIRFGVMESQVLRQEKDINLIQTQICDLNYVKGKAEGLASIKQ